MHLTRTSSLRRSTRLRVAVPLAVAGLLVPLAGSAAAQKPQEAETYVASDAVIPNPERGFYKHTETHYYADGSGYVPLDEATLRSYRDLGITQVLRVFYLEKFSGTDTIDQAYLDLMAADLATAEAAGVSVIVRFAYHKPTDSWPYQPPYYDAPAERVVKHIEQLGPVLRDASAVIATVQSGFVGLWGEGYYTDHFSKSPAEPYEITEENWADRKAVIDALLDNLPGLTVQVRTMSMKQMTYGNGDPSTGAAGAMTEADAYSGSDISRIGFHNDCFLTPWGDYGTFLSDPVTLDEEYLAQETQWVPMGGETCEVTERSGWETAEAELARYHWSYLNTDYNRDVLASWGENVETVKKRLGYRFTLESATFGDVAKHRSFPISLTIENSGWAAPYNPRPVNLVMVGAAGTYTVPLGEDARTWAAGETTTVTADVCAAVPAGTYDLYLSLPSSSPELADNPDYAIQLSNVGTWDAANGWNDLQHTVRVESAGQHAGPNGCTAQSVKPLS